MGNLIVPVVRRGKKPRHGEVKQLASDHTAFRQLSQSLNTDILSGTMCYRNRGKEMISSVQSLSRVQLFATPWAAARQASLSITNSWSSPRLMSIKSVMPSSHLILCCPLLLLPSIFPSIRVFSDKSSLCIRWPKYWSFSFNISPFNEHSRLLSFRIGWISLHSKGLSRVFSNTTVQKHQFFRTQLSSQLLFHLIKTASERACHSFSFLNHFLISFLKILSNLDLDMTMTSCQT